MYTIIMENDLREKVKQTALRTMSVPEIRVVVDQLNEALGTADEDIIKAWLIWDAEKEYHGNEMYNSEAMRVAMYLHNFIPGSWHEKRQELVLSAIKNLKPKSICEMGFGTPQKYVKYATEHGSKLLLSDVDISSINFAKIIFESQSIKWRNKVQFGIVDMDRDSIPSDYQVYIFQDSLEHAIQPKSVLTQLVSNVEKGVNFLFTLPIEIDKPVKEHNICFTSSDQCIRWVEDCGLQISRHEDIQINREVDLFAQKLHPQYHELLILAHKL